MLRLALISCSGVTSIGSGSTPMTMSRPRTASPSITGVIALALVTVASTARAPPRWLSAAATPSVALSMKWCAPSLRASASLSPPRAIATVRKPSLLANCTPRWPSPPIPRIATTSPGIAPLRRSAGSTASDSTSHHTAVDIVDRASRPAGVIGQKEHDVVGEILRPAYAADRVECIETLGQGLLDLVRIDERIEERCHGHSRRHRVYPDPVTAELHREILGEGVQASLLHRIGR